MGWTNETTGYGLPLFADGDKPSWRGDVNYFISKIDGVMYAAIKDRKVINGGLSGATNVIKAAVNLIQGYAGNAIAPDIYGAVVVGGGQSGNNNVVGNYSDVDRDNISTAPHPDKTVTNGSRAHYSVVGGYDNAAGGIASLLLSFHSWTAALNTCTHPTIVGGSLHKIRNGEYGGIFAGQGSDMSGSFNGIVAGVNNTIDGLTTGAGILATNTGAILNSAGAALLGGQQLQAVNAKFSVVSGLRARAKHYGARIHGSGWFTVIGDAQYGDYSMRRQGLSGTLALDGAGALLTLEDNQVVAFTALVSAVAVGGGSAGAWMVSGAATRATGAASTRMLQAATITSLGKDVAAWNISVAANVAGDIRVTFVGDGTTQIKIFARVSTSEVVG